MIRFNDSEVSRREVAASFAPTFSDINPQMNRKEDAHSYWDNFFAQTLDFPTMTDEELFSGELQ